MTEVEATVTRQNRSALVRWAALAVGVVLFFGTLYYINFRLAFGTIRQLGVALPLALLFSGLWHLARTWAWAWCFPSPRRVSFLRLARVRLSAEAFSYLTLRGIAGEPLKVVLLADRVDPRRPPPPLRSSGSRIWLGPRSSSASDRPRQLPACH